LTPDDNGIFEFSFNTWQASLREMAAPTIAQTQLHFFRSILGCRASTESARGGRDYLDYQVMLYEKIPECDHSAGVDAMGIVSMLRRNQAKW